MPDINMPAPRVPLLDNQGLVAPVWYLFFSRLGGSATDGNKGDITVSGGGAAFAINDGVVDTDALGGDITTFGKSLLIATDLGDLAITAASLPYVEGDITNWDGNVQTENVAAALDQLARRVKNGSWNGGTVYQNIAIDTTDVGTGAAFGANGATGTAANFIAVIDGITRANFGFDDSVGHARFGIRDATGDNPQVAMAMVHDAEVSLRWAGAARIDTDLLGVTVAGTVSQKTQESTVANGGSTTIDNDARTLLMTNGSLQAAHTVTMPASPKNGQVVTIACGAFGVTTLTHSPNSGQTLRGALMTAVADTAKSWIYRLSNTTWYVVG